MRRSRSDNAGFSLVEMVVALSVLTVGALGALQMYNVGLSNAAALKERVLARTLVENELQRIKAAPFARLEDAAKKAFAAGQLQDSELHLAEGTAEVRDYPELDGALKEVEVQLRWIGRKGGLKTYSATILVADMPRAGGAG